MNWIQSRGARSRNPLIAVASRTIRYVRHAASTEEIPDLLQQEATSVWADISGRRASNRRLKPRRLGGRRLKCPGRGQIRPARVSEAGFGRPNYWGHRKRSALPLRHSWTSEAKSFGSQKELHWVGFVSQKVPKRQLRNLSAPSEVFRRRWSFGFRGQRRLAGPAWRRPVRCFRCGRWRHLNPRPGQCGSAWHGQALGTVGERAWRRTGLSPGPLAGRREIMPWWPPERLVTPKGQRTSGCG